MTFETKTLCQHCWHCWLNKLKAASVLSHLLKSTSALNTTTSLGKEVGLGARVLAQQCAGAKQLAPHILDFNLKALWDEGDPGIQHFKDVPKNSRLFRRNANLLIEIIMSHGGISKVDHVEADIMRFLIWVEMFSTWVIVAQSGKSFKY